MARLKITQVKSRIGATERQCKNLDALGLKRINASVEHDDSVIIKGMIARVKHLVKVEEVAPAKKAAAPKAKKAEVKEEAARGRRISLTANGTITMELNNLKPAKGSTHHDKRIGRGAGSGHGGTATRGHKGAQSRSGYSRKLGFEGGQMPLQRRLPKFGFTNLKRVEFKAINLSTLEELAAKKSLTEVTVDTLIAAGFISSNDKVKILGNGTVIEGARA